MYITLHSTFGTVPADSSYRPDPDSGNISGINERFAFEADDVPSATSVFVLRPENYPTEKVFIPPYFVPPNRASRPHGLNERSSPEWASRRISAASPGRHSMANVHSGPKATSVSEKRPVIAGRSPSIGLPDSVPRQRQNNTSDDSSQQESRTTPPADVMDAIGLEYERELNWSRSSRRAFHTMISEPNYVNRYRLRLNKRRKLLHYLQNPTEEPVNPDGNKDHQTRYQAANWTQRDGRLYRQPAAKKPKDSDLRRHLDEDEVWDVLTAEHLKSGHLGRDKLRKSLEKVYIGYTLQEIMFVLRECRKCNGGLRGGKDTEGDVLDEGMEIGQQRYQVEGERAAQHELFANSNGAREPFVRRQTSNFMSY